jgi:acyl-CoA reductase-like NAD-dependent aldehyde dehydrogenase
VELVQRLVNRAVQQGARVLVGGIREGAGKGQFYPPTVLCDVTPEMEIMQQELFGPVMLLCRVSGEEQAVEVAEGTRFGLGCTILSKDPQRAARIARRLRTGGVSVNEFGLTYMAMDLPFGGVKASGYGRLNGRDGLRAMTNPRAVLSDRLPLHVPSRLYPVGPGDYELARGVIQSIYSPGLGARARAAWGTALGALRRGRSGRG